MEIIRYVNKATLESFLNHNETLEGLLKLSEVTCTPVSVGNIPIKIIIPELPEGDK